MDQHTSNDITDKVKNVFFNISECHFALGHQPVCSPKPLVKKMKSFVEKKGKQVSDDPKEIVESTKKIIKCKTESCILKNSMFLEFLKKNNLDEYLTKFFKPEGPSDSFGLLSNFNIDNVLDQLEQKFKHKKFLHIPFQMRDFERIGTQLATIDLADKFNEGYKTFGVVLNTDYSTGVGVHWFCLFGEHYGDKIVLEYFNSSGQPPLPEVQAWLQKTKHHLHKQLKIPVEIYYGKNIQYQNDNHSCGVYCLCYIWLRLEDVPCQWFKSDNFSDQLMHLARKNLFISEL